MPIYAYRCASCGHAKDVLQKLSDPPLTVCPSCGASSFAKQVTAAGFQLKGSGWYATDFKGNGAKKPDSGDGAKTDGAKTDGATTETAKTDGAKTDGAKTDAGKSGDSVSSGGSTSPGESSGPKAAGCGGGCACH
jgi:putative FmdB family regulatory protein